MQPSAEYPVHFWYILAPKGLACLCKSQTAYHAVQL